MKSIRHASICALLSVLGSSVVSAATLTLSTVGDTFVREDNPGSTAGASSAELLVGQLSPTSAFHGLLTFDLSTIPLNATIDSVSLVLRQQTEDSASSVTTVTLQLHQVDQSFTVTQASWNNLATGTAWTTPGGTFDATLLSSASVAARPSQVSGSVPADVAFSSSTSFVSSLQAAYDASSGSISFLLMDANEDDSGRQLIRFASSESAFSPQLIINYTSAIPEPSSLAFLLGGAGLVTATFLRRRSV